jgi:anti-anti-sigma regulatory factor
MAIQLLDFEIKDIDKRTIQIRITEQFTGTETDEVRALIDQAIKNDDELVYLDLRSINNIDLSGINEIIHAHHTLRRAQKSLVLIYTKDGVLEKWLANTKLDLFVSTAMVPPSLVYEAKKSNKVSL